MQLHDVLSPSTLWHRDQTGSDNPISVKLNIRTLLVINSWQLVYVRRLGSHIFAPLILIFQIGCFLRQYCAHE